MNPFTTDKQLFSEGDFIPKMFRLTQDECDMMNTFVKDRMCLKDFAIVLCNFSDQIEKDKDHHQHHSISLLLHHYGEKLIEHYKEDASHDEKK